MFSVRLGRNCCNTEIMLAQHICYESSDVSIITIIINISISYFWSLNKSDCFTTWIHPYMSCFTCHMPSYWCFTNHMTACRCCTNLMTPRRCRCFTCHMTHRCFTCHMTFDLFCNTCIWLLLMITVINQTGQASGGAVVWDWDYSMYEL